MNDPTLNNTNPDPGRSGIGNDAHGSAQQRLTNQLYAPIPENTIPQSFDGIDWTSRALSCLRWAHTHYRLGEYQEARVSLIEFEIADLRSREHHKDTPND